VAPVGAAGADATAPPARGVAAVEPLPLEAPVLAGAPLVRTVAAAWPNDLAAPVVGASPARTPAAAGRRCDRAGVPFDAGAARPALQAALSSERPTRSALEVVISSVGATPVDREDVMTTASE